MKAWSQTVCTSCRTRAFLTNTRSAEATILKLDVDTSLSLEEARHSLNTNKRNQDIAKTKNIQDNDKAYENKVIALKRLIKDTEVRRKQLEIN